MAIERGWFGGERRRQHRHRGQLGGVGLGRRNRQLASCVGFQRQVGRLGQRAGPVVGHGHRSGASRGRPLQGLDDLAGLAGLGDAHHEGVPEVDLGVVVGGDARGGEAGHPVGVRLDEVAAVDAGVVGRAPRDEEHVAGAGGKPRQLGTDREEDLEGTRDGLRLFGDLAGHPGRHTVAFRETRQRP